MAAKPETQSGQLFRLALAGVGYTAMQSSGYGLTLPGGFELSNDVAKFVVALLAFFIPRILGIWFPAAGEWAAKLLERFKPSQDELVQQAIDLLADVFKDNPEATKGLKCLHDCNYERKVHEKSK